LLRIANTIHQGGLQCCPDVCFEAACVDGPIVDGAWTIASCNPQANPTPSSQECTAQATNCLNAMCAEGWCCCSYVVGVVVFYSLIILVFRFLLYFIIVLFFIVLSLFLFNSLLYSCFSS